MITLDQYRAAQRERAKPADPAQATRNLQAVQQAAVSAAEMTGHPAWDRFLSYLQGALDGATAQRAQLLEQIGSPAAIDREHVDYLRTQAIRLGAHAEILRHVIALPGDIMRDGEKAVDLLSRMGNVDDQADAG